MNTDLWVAIARAINKHSTFVWILAILVILAWAGRWVNGAILLMLLRVVLWTQSLLLLGILLGLCQR